MDRGQVWIGALHQIFEATEVLGGKVRYHVAIAGVAHQVQEKSSHSTSTKYGFHQEFSPLLRLELTMHAWPM